MRSDAVQPRKGPLLTFHDIEYTVKKKAVLRGVSGACRPGQVTAILGPTGGGKSSLLDVLADRKDRRKVRGQVLVDGVRRSENFMVESGYCTQQDMLMGTLTVRENLMFNAQLRLSEAHTAVDRVDRVEAVIAELRLGKCADSFVGTDLIRGVSGGEKKRCSIAMELVTRPRVLFLDEPTTGLDASTACVVVSILEDLAHKGMTVVLSIHQPRYSIFRGFHSLMVLSDGQLVYHGSAGKALAYFERVSGGLKCQPFDNPPDFIMDVVSRYTPRRPSTDLVTDDTISVEEGKSDAEANPVSAVDKWLGSSEHEELQRELQAIHAAQPPLSPLALATFAQKTLRQTAYRTSFWRQLRTLTHRAALSLLRNPAALIFQTLATVGFSVLVGGIYYQLGNGPMGLQNRIGAFFFIIMSFIFSNLSGIELFIQERALFLHEKTSGYYRASAYFLAKALCDVWLMRVIPSTAFCAVAYHMIGLRPGLWYFGVFLLVMISTGLSSASLCFLASCITPIFAVANVGVALVFVFMMVPSGLLLNLRSLPAWVAPLKYVSLFRYAMEALAVSQLDGFKFDCQGGGGMCVPDGSLYLEAYGYDPSNLWPDVLALLIMFLAFMALAYARLATLRKE